MTQMAHHTVPNNAPHIHNNQPAFLAIRPVPYAGNVPRREMAPDEMLYSREMAKSREAHLHTVDAQEWLARQKGIDLHSLHPEVKRELLAQNEEVRKHLEHDAYFIANQEYLRLMNDEPSRQTFREKQRLTEDLEKQKRLLIEDLARDQQLKQDKYKRNQTPTYPNDLRTLHYLNEKALRGEVPMRGKPPEEPLHSPRVDPRYPLHFASPEEFYAYRRLHENMMQVKPSNLPARPLLPDSRADFKQCLHSDFNGQSLMPIIQEKEKKIKEMEEKLMRLEQEERLHQLHNTVKKIETSNHSTVDPPQRQFSPHSTSTAHTLPTPTEITNNNKNQQLPPDKNNNNQRLLNESNILRNTTAAVTIDANRKSVSPKSNSPVDELVIDMNEDPKNSSSFTKKAIEDSIETIDGKQASLIDPNLLVRLSPSDNIKIESNTQLEDENVRTEVIDDDKSFNELKYSNNNEMVELSSTVVKTEDCMTTFMSTKDDDDDIHGDDGSTSSGNLDSEGIDGNHGGTKIQQKKRKGPKVSTKKEESNTTQDFQECQNRLALDLPKHNWLVERLKQQKKLAADDLPIIKPNVKMTTNAIKDEANKELELNSVSIKEEQNSMKVLSSSREKSSENESSRLPVNKEASAEDNINTNKSKSPRSTEESETPNNASVLTKSEKKSINPDSKQNMPKSKTPPHSELLLKMLDPNKSNPQLTSPSRINPPNAASSPPTTISLSSTVLDVRTHQSITERNSPQKESTKDVITREQLERSQNTITPRKSPIVINDRPNERHFSTPPLLTSMEGVMKKEAGNLKSDFTQSQIRPRSTSSIVSPSKQRGDAPYQEVRPNLVVERRRDSDNQQYVLPKTQQYYAALHSVDNTSYSKFIVEERYNRKRPVDEATARQQEAAQKHADFSKKFFMDLERGMTSVGEHISTDKKERRVLSSEPPSFPRHLEQLSPRERATKVELPVNEYNYLSRFKESSSQPLLYKSHEQPLKSPVLHTRKSPVEPQPGYIKRNGSPSPVGFRHQSAPSEEKAAMEKNLYAFHDRRRSSMAERLPMNGRIERHLVPTSLGEITDPMLFRHMRESREHEMKIFEEARKREELQRTAEARKETLFPPPPGSKAAHYKGMSIQGAPGELDHLLPYNERVRTVEDLRALQLGIPIDNYRRYIRPPFDRQRNERLTEREKLALREADIINQASIRQDVIPSRQNIHTAYLEHARRKGSVPASLTSPTASIRPPPHGLSEEQIRLATYRRQKEEEEKLRALNEQRDPYILHKEMDSGHFDPNIPRFFSHKIPRTRDGSLDFGRSKPVDYSFLDYPAASLREREALHNSMKRPSSAHAPETIAKFPRRTPPQSFIPAEVYKRLSEDEKKQAHARAEKLPYEEKWRMIEGGEKRFCSICSKDAQYLCSGCRKVWYCSQTCQLNAWKHHCKTCTQSER